MNPTVQGYVPFVDFLEAVLGKNSEIVLHDFSDPDHSVVDIRNGDVSGRKIGSPAAGLALKILNESARGNDQYADQHHITEYVSHSSSMKQLRSASYLIRENGLIVGMLCVNTDVGPFNRINSPGSTRPHSAPQATTAILTPLKSRASPTLPKTLSSAPSRASPRRAASPPTS